MKILLKLQMLVILLAFSIQSNAQECPFTFDQGYDIGCAMAQAANEAGCYEVDCWPDAYNTINLQPGDILNECDDYIAGIEFGFNECNNPPYTTYPNPKELPPCEGGTWDPLQGWICP